MSCDPLILISSLELLKLNLVPEIELADVTGGISMRLAKYSEATGGSMQMTRPDLRDAASGAQYVMIEF